MMNNDERLCPFSKAIIGQWCCCKYARLSDPDRCAGKMHCQHPDNHLQTCRQLLADLEKNSRFILGVSHTDSDKPLTHQQYMKIKCGGMEGMQRVLAQDTEQLPCITDIAAQIIIQYGSLAHFPYADIVRDIAGFSHRKLCRPR